MKHAVLALGVLIQMSAVAAWAQSTPPKIVEARFHRVHLRNGNVIDGQLIKFTPTGVLLKVRFGEFEVRNDLVARTEDGKLRVEFVKLKSIDKGPEIVDSGRKKPDPKEGTVKPDPFERKDPKIETPEPPSADVPPELRQRVDGLLRQMIRMNEDERVQVIQDLIKLGPGAAIHIAENLDRIPPSIQSEASEVLVAGDSREALPHLVKLLDHKDPKIRTRAVHAIGGVGNRSSARHLRPRLKDADAGVRGAAVVMLERMEDRGSYNAIAALIGDSEPNVQSAALSALYKMARKNGEEERLRRTLLAGLRRVRGKARAEVVNSVARLEIKESWQDLAPYLSDSAPVVRQAVAVALQKLNDPQAGPAILDRLSLERDRWTRVYLATCVQKFRLRGAIDPLIEWLRDDDEQIRKVAGVALQTLTNQKLPPQYERWRDWRKANSR